ncbi:Rho gtpase-activating protein [Thalictrum thalictroides]|uniref:Rho gtpase-activating protein n=1 Tax=Thalictrum thalictroides TaxID=46969 RepID=A0A7J6X118_THATH|nr:Rho gtpase-activating protein [Thalictrum thalictroides]
MADGHSKLQKHSACKRSEFAANGFIPLSKQFSSKLKARLNTQASNASTVTSMEASSSKTMFPKLTISPLRRFMLVVSDTDDSSSSEDSFEDAKKVDISASKRPRNTNNTLTINQQKGKNVTGDTKPETEDLWKDFGSQKGVNIQTPALDEFCQEFFTSAKGKNTERDKDKNIYVTSSKLCDQKKCISENAELYKSLDHPLPSAYKYFYHDDPRIQRLVRQRLPNFFPLGVNTENPQSQAAEIDYMFQFSQREPTSRNQSLAENSRMGGKNLRQLHHKDLTEAPGSWVNPKGRANAKKNAGKSQGRVAGCSSVGPKNAGKRRVRAEGCSSGSWFTGEDGKKVYVTKTGKELTGQMAYRHYRRESGIAFKKSRKKAAPKKKAKH